MPIYEYHCAACEKIGEYLQKMADPIPDACRFCGEGPLQKKVSQSAFVLKGGGWYVTDFRDGDQKKKAAAQSTSTPETSHGEAKTGDRSDASGASTDGKSASTEPSGKSEPKKDGKKEPAKASSSASEKA